MSTRPWFSDYAMSPARRRNLELEDKLKADGDYAWRKAAYEAMERIVKNHYSPKVPPAARKHNTKNKKVYLYGQFV